MNRENQPFRRRTVLKTVGTSAVASSAFAGIAVGSDHCEDTVEEGESVNAAISNADAGDTICVESGTYEESLGGFPENLTLTGATGDRDDVVIDTSDQGGYGIDIDDTPGVELSNMTIIGINNGDNRWTINTLHDGGAFLSGITLENLKIDGGESTAIDLHGIENARIEDVYVQNAGQATTPEQFEGAAVALTDARNVEITNLTATNNNGAGVAMWARNASWMNEGAITDITITGSKLTGNTAGVELIYDPDEGEPQVDDVVVNFNNIKDNGPGVLSVDASLDATDNWWGHASGPGGPDGRTNPAGNVVGKGDGIEIDGEGDVEFDPWLRRSIDHPSR